MNTFDIDIGSAPTTPESGDKAGKNKTVHASASTIAALGTVLALSAGSASSGVINLENGTSIKLDGSISWQDAGGDPNTTPITGTYLFADESGNVFSGNAQMKAFTQFAGTDNDVLLDAVMTDVNGVRQNVQLVINFMNVEYPAPSAVKLLTNDKTTYMEGGYTPTYGNLYVGNGGFIEASLPTTAAVPEPSTNLLGVAGLAMLAGMSRFRGLNARVSKRK